MGTRNITVEVETPETVHASATLFLEEDSAGSDAMAKRWLEFIVNQWAELRPGDDVRGITVNVQWPPGGRVADPEGEEVAA